MRRWGSPGIGLGELDFNRDPSDPTDLIGGVAFGPDGSVYVVEAGNKRVQRFSAAGEPELTWGEPGTGDGQFVDPIGIAVSAAGEVFVVDDRRNDIQVFTRDGEYRRTIGRKGDRCRRAPDTGNIRFGPDGLLVNADFGNDRVQAWDAQEMTSPGRSDRQGRRLASSMEPQDVAFGADGTLLVVDDHRVQAFDARGARHRRLAGSTASRPSRLDRLRRRRRSGCSRRTPTRSTRSGSRREHDQPRSRVGPPWPCTTAAGARPRRAMMRGQPRAQGAVDVLPVRDPRLPRPSRRHPRLVAGRPGRAGTWPSTPSSGRSWASSSCPG